MFLIKRIICPITISTTDLVLLYGALKTIIPFFLVKSKLIWFVPIQNAPITKSLFALDNIFLFKIVFDLIPIIDAFLIQILSEENAI